MIWNDNVYDSGDRNQLGEGLHIVPLYCFYQNRFVSIIDEKKNWEINRKSSAYIRIKWMSVLQTWDQHYSS